MALIDRILGTVAAVNATRGAGLVNRYIPLNGLVLVLLVVAFVDGFDRIRGPQPAGTSALVRAIPILEIVLPPSLLGPSVICLMRRNLIFRPTDRHLTRRATGSGADRRKVDLRVSGWFRRDGSRSVWIRDCPGACKVSEDGTISLVASVAWGGCFHGSASFAEDPSGMWSFVLPRESLK
jgi:hypothetical protein